MPTALRCLHRLSCVPPHAFTARSANAPREATRPTAATWGWARSRVRKPLLRGRSRARRPSWQRRAAGTATPARFQARKRGARAHRQSASLAGASASRASGAPPEASRDTITPVRRAANRHPINRQPCSPRHRLRKCAPSTPPPPAPTTHRLLPAFPRLRPTQLGPTSNQSWSSKLITPPGRCCHEIDWTKRHEMGRKTQQALGRLWR